ncbi:nuclear transport factor 2 family protein, partial [Dietzia sp. DQ12-76]|uniref:nuclear transport factor 2 family protein n=1 Tax=Dietzia sp. DQ12-76 TaxID=1630639 RepID=UPI0015FE1369
RTGTAAAARAATAPPSEATGSADSEPNLFSLADPAPTESPSAPRAPSSTTPHAASGESAVDLVVELEQSLLSDAVRADRRRLETLLDPSWRNVCARGEVWSREDRLAASGSPDQTSAERTMEIIEARELTSDTVLLVWREHMGGSSILRSSVWVRSQDSWRQAFQQGTAES